jgi:hypothetical protein
MVTVEQWQTVVGAPDYEVVQAGDYELLSLVLCRRKIDTNGPTCQFLAATVVGIDPAEVQE